MPPLYDYECSECGDVIEVEHEMAGPRSTKPPPEGVGYVFTKNETIVYHEACEQPPPDKDSVPIMVKLISAPHLVTIRRGNHDFPQRERERLKKRSQEHWDKVGRQEAIEKAEAKGNVVPTSWLKKQVMKTRKARR